MEQQISLLCRSLSQKPIIRIIQCTDIDQGVSLLVESPIPIFWLKDGYLWDWSYSAKHQFSAETKEEAIDKAHQKIQWIIEWEQRKVTEIFYRPESPSL